MGIFGNKSNQTVQERYQSDLKIQNSLVLIYLLIVFSYSVAIVLLTYQQYINFSPDLPDSFTQLIDNWQQKPIQNIVISDKVKNTDKITNFQIGNQFYSFEIQYYDNYNFQNNYTLNIDCDDGFKLCGGVEDDSKYCIPQALTCFYNDLYITGDETKRDLISEINYKSLVQYPTSIFYLQSSFQSKSIITNLFFGINGKACKNQTKLQFLNCEEITLNAYAIQSFNATNMLINNSIIIPDNITITENDTITLHAQRYVEFDLVCRYSLMERIYESPDYYQSLAYILYIQTILTLVYCIFIGIILNITHFFMLSDFSFFLTLSMFDQYKIKIIRRIIYTIRFLSYLPYGTIICLLYFYEAQFYDTINRIHKEKCIQDEFQFIFSNLLTTITNFRIKQIAVFWIFISSLVIEILASFVIIYRSANAKKKNLLQKQYEHEIEIKHDEKQLFRQSVKQQNRPVIRQSFTPNDQQTIRESVKNYNSNSQRNKNNNVLQIIEEEQQQQQYPYYQTNQLRESIKPVLTFNHPQQTISTPTNNYFQ